VKWLDELVGLFHDQHSTPSRSPAWMLDNDTPEDVEDDVDQHAGVSAKPLRSKPPVIEVISAQSASGKTGLLYLLTAHALHPVSHGGKASAAVWIDADGRFSIDRLVRIMQQVINTSTQPDPSDILIESALRNLIILTPTSSTHLLTLLHSLPSTLLQTRSPMPLSLLILDSTTAFTAQDRSDADMARLEAGPDFSSRPQPPTRTAQIIAALRSIQQTFECAVAFSSNTNSTTPAPGANPTNPHPSPSRNPDSRPLHHFLLPHALHLPHPHHAVRTQCFAGRLPARPGEAAGGDGGGAVFGGVGSARE
jgi:hypothetical protein